MLTVESAREPSWNVERTAINLLVVFEEHAATLGAIPFTASPEDSEAHGRDLFARAMALEFGVILEPSAEVLEHASLLTRSLLTVQATTAIGGLQVALDTIGDAIRLGLATEAEAASQQLKQAEFDAWCAYRVLLSRVEAQSGFPAAIEWPEIPAKPFELVG